MTREYLEFPDGLEYTIKRKTNNSIEIDFYGGTHITNEVFNMAFIEPFKVVFTNKRKRRHIICFMIEQSENGKKTHDFYIGSIARENKRSLTAILRFVNQAL